MFYHILYLLVVLFAIAEDYVFNAEFPQIHICRDGGEVYAGAYLTTKEHLIWENFKQLNMTGRLTCERASFMVFRSKANPKWDIEGTPVQTLDLLDFSVIHLSAYERLQRKFWRPLKAASATRIPILDKLKTTIQLLQDKEYTRDIVRKHNLDVPEWNRTLAIMPILLSGMGKGHSKIENRIGYLRSCFWSLHAIIPNIVITVASVDEKIHIEKVLQLPVYEVVVLFNLNRTDALPAATVIEARDRFRDGRWDFDFLFYTESDQLLMLRRPRVLFDYLKAYPQRVLVPHRLMAYPTPLLSLVFRKDLAALQPGAPHTWMNMSCCMPRTNCLGDRESWQGISHESVVVTRVLNLAVALGNSNFLKQQFRACSLIRERVDQCP